MMISGEGKTIYTDAKSLSDDFERRIEDGDEDVIPRLEEIAKAEDPEQPHSRARALYELAQIYFKGLCGVEKSSEKGLEYLNQRRARIKKRREKSIGIFSKSRRQRQ